MRIGDALEPNNLRLVFQGFDVVRDLARDMRDDLSFVRAAIRALGPARRHAGRAPGPVFEPARPLDLAALRGARVGVLASGGSGATASLVGVQRALEAHLEWSRARGARVVRSRATTRARFSRTTTMVAAIARHASC